MHLQKNANFHSPEETYGTRQAVPPCTPSECHRNKAEIGKGKNANQLAITHGALSS